MKPQGDKWPRFTIHRGVNGQVRAVLIDGVRLKAVTAVTVADSIDAGPLATVTITQRAGQVETVIEEE